MAKKEIVILDLKVNVDETKNKMAVIRQETVLFAKENRELKKAILAAYEKGNTKAVEELSKLLSENETKVKALSREYKNHGSTLDRVTRLNEAAEGSYEQLLQQYELASVQLKLQENLLERNAEGQIVLTDAYKTQAEKVKIAKDAVDKFNKGIGDGRSSVGQYAEAIKDAFGETGLFGTQLEVLKKGFAVAKGGADLFKNGLQGIGAAMATTGIPLLANILNLLIGLFQKNEKAAEKFEQVMSFIGSIFGDIVGVAIKVGSAIVNAFEKPKEAALALWNTLKPVRDILVGFATLDLKQMVGGFKAAAEGASNFVKESIDAANQTAALTKRTQELEDKERDLQVLREKNKFAVDDLIKRAKEQTVSEEERLSLLSQAAAIEKEALETEKQLASEKVDILHDQNELLKQRGQLRDEDSQKEVDAQTHLVQLTAESAAKIVEINNNSAKLIKQLRAQEIQQQVDALNTQLQVAEAKGQDTVNLIRAIAKKERDVRLQEFGLSAAQEAQIQADFQAKLTIIAENEKKKRIELARQTEDVKLAFIADANTREIAEITLQGTRKLDAIKGNSPAEIALRSAIEEDIQLKLLAVQERIQNETLATRLDNIQKNGDAEKQVREAGFQEQENNLRIALSKQEITKDEFAQKSQQLAIDRAADELALLNQLEAEKQLALDVNLANDVAGLQTKFDAGLISKETYESAVTKLEADAEIVRAENKAVFDAAQLTAEQNLQNAKVDAVVDGNNRIIADEERAKSEREKIQGALVGLYSESFALISDLLSQDEEDKKKNAGILKTIALAQVALNLVTEISGYWKGVGVDTGTTGNIVGAAGSSAIAAANTAAAVIRAAAASAKIASTKTYAGGGFTGSGMFGADQTGHRVAGVVHANEWVSPPRMLSHPVTAPIIRSLESFRQTGTLLPFADGGFTTQFITRQMESGGMSEAMVMDIIQKKVQIVASSDEISQSQNLTATIKQTAQI